MHKPPRWRDKAMDEYKALSQIMMAVTDWHHGHINKESAMGMVEITLEKYKKFLLEGQNND